MALMDRTVGERQETAGRGRGNDIQQWLSSAGLKPWLTAAWTEASTHGAPAQPTTPRPPSSVCVLIQHHFFNLLIQTLKFVRSPRYADVAHLELEKLPERGQYVNSCG